MQEGGDRSCVDWRVHKRSIHTSLIHTTSVGPKTWGTGYGFRFGSGQAWVHT